MDKRINRCWLFLAIAFLSLGPHAFNLNPLGFRVDWNLPYDIVAMHSMWQGTDGLTPWNSANTGTSLFYPTLAPFLVLISALSYVLPNAGLVERVVLVASLLIAQEGMFLLARRYVADNTAAVIAAVAYGTGTFVFTKISQGVLQEVLSYAMLPFVALAVEVAADQKWAFQRYSYAALSGVLVLIASVQTQYAPICMILIALVCWVRKAWLVGVIATLTAVASEAYAILPLAVSIRATSTQFLQLSPLEELVSWAPTIDEALRQAGYIGRFAENAVAQGSGFGLWWLAGIVMGAFAFCGYWWQGDRRARTFGSTLLATVLFAASPKFAPALFQWLLIHVPLVSLFRETYHVESVVAFFEALGLAYFCAHADRAVQSVRVRSALLFITVLFVFARFGQDRTAIALMAIAVLLVWRPWRTVRQDFAKKVAAALVVAVVVIASPFVGAGLGSQVQSFTPPPQSSVVAETLRNFEGGRVAYLPFLLPLRPVGAAFSGVDAAISWSPLPSFGNYVPSRIAKQFASALYSRDTQEARMLADWLDIRYVDERHWVEDVFKDSVPLMRTGRFASTAFSVDDAMATYKALGLKQIGDDGPESLYELRKPQQSGDQIASADSLVVLDGTLSGAARTYGRYQNVAFVSQNRSAAISALLSAGAAIAIEGGNPLGLELSFVDSRYRYDPGVYAPALSADQNWGNQNAWNSWWWLNHNYMAPLTDVAMVARFESHTLRFPAVSHHGRVTIGVKYYAGLGAGKLQISFGRQRWKTNALEPGTQPGFRWFVASAEAKNGDALSISNSPDNDGVVANAIVMPSKLLSEARLSVSRLNITRLQYILQGQHYVDVLRAGQYRLLSRCAGRVMTSTLRLKAGAADLKSVVGQSCIADRLELLGANAPAPRSTTPFVAHAGYRYSGRITKGPAIAILNTGYSNMWKSKQPAVHFMINGYANGWLARSKADDFEVLPVTQDLLHAGEAITLVTIAITLLCLIASRKVPYVASR